MKASYRFLPVIFLISPAFLQAQVPVDDAGRVIGQSSGSEIMHLGDDDIPRLSSIELQELVGPVALYPDDLLAVVLPASAYPLQIAAAARFLEAREEDPTLEPNPDWDDSVIALLNYPEVVELLNDDLDWTYRLGEAVVAQQADVVAAVEAFRDRVYAAGNLRSDEYQTIERADDVIRITPVSDDVIYVPYYEPERVVVYQPRPVYYYYPRPCPVYYYPYSAGYHFDRGFFWGVTTAFTMGWHSNSLHVYHHSYRGHPYYGRHYRDYWWYRRPSINIHNTTYITNNNRNTNVNVTRTVNIDRGDLWHPRSDRREYVIREGYTDRTRGTTTKTVTTRTQPTPKVRERQPVSIRFRDRAFADDTWTPRDGSRRERVSRTNSVRDTNPSKTARTSGSTTDRRYVPPKTDLQVPVTRGTDTRRQEPVRSTRQEPSRSVRQAPVRTVRPEPSRTVRPEPTRTVRPEPSRTVRQQPTRTVRPEPSRTVRQQPSRSVRQEPPRRETSRPQRQERAAPQRQSTQPRSSAPRPEPRDRGERRPHKRK